MYTYEKRKSQKKIMKKVVMNLRNTKICSKVTPEEKDLLAAIRNYNKSFPDGYPELLWYAQQLFDNMLRQPYL